MPKPLLIVVSGPPAAGKTTIATKVAEEFRLPLLSRDDIKETLFDTLGWSDREWSRNLGLASVVMLFKLIEIQLKAGRSAVAESNFYTELDKPRFEQLCERYDFDIFQVHCEADADVLVTRFLSRAGSDERHPGHVDLVQEDELMRNLSRGTWDTLKIGGWLHRMNTTYFDEEGYELLFQAIRQAGETR